MQNSAKYRAVNDFARVDPFYLYCDVAASGLLPWPGRSLSSGVAISAAALAPRPQETCEVCLLFLTAAIRLAAPCGYLCVFWSEAAMELGNPWPHSFNQGHKPTSCLRGLLKIGTYMTFDGLRFFFGSSKLESSTCSFKNIELGPAPVCFLLNHARAPKPGQPEKHE